MKLSAEQNKLVEENAPLAKFLARRRWEAAPNVLELDDMVSLAFQGLVQAAQRWRAYSEENALPEEEIVSAQGFSIFARKRILGAILDWQKRDADYVPRSYRTDYNILRRSGYPDNQKDLTKLSQVTGLSLERITLVITAVSNSPVSFDEVIEAAGSNVPESKNSVESTALVQSVGDAVADAIIQMSDLQQIVLALRYYEQRDLQSIADELGMPVVPVRELHNEAIMVVHAAMLAVVVDRNQ